MPTAARTSLSFVAAMAVVLPGAGNSLPAQVSAPARPPSVVLVRDPATINGIVTDMAGAPVSNARVQVADLRRKVNTKDDGTFTLPGLPSGDTLEVIVGRIGYRPLHLEVTLVPGANALTVTLESIAQQLDAVRTVSEQTGVFGVVGDTAYEVVPDARVTLTSGTGAERLTNAIGQFAIGTVKAGGNFLEVRKVGFKPRLVSFMQPATGGTKLAIWLTPWPPGAPAWWSEFPKRTVQALYDFRGRARYRNSRAAIVTRDMLGRYGTGLRLSDALDQMPGGLTKGSRAGDFSRVIQDDIEIEGFTLQDFNADDVELVELYPAGSDLATAVRTGGSMRRTTSMTSMSGSGARSAAAGAVARVWLRR